MAEEAEGQDAGAEASPSGVDPAAIALALNSANVDPGVASDLRTYLRHQSALVTDQRHHLHEQLRQLGPRLWELRLGVLLRIATAFIGIAVAAALAWLVWNAANSNDLVIDAFAVPPDLAAHGLSGTVVAAKLSDKIAAMQADTVSSRPAKSYANGLTEGLKLEIPETGISLSELNRFLREQLGHDVHIGGELLQTDKGVALTARVGTNSATVEGASSQTDSLLQQLAEQVYRVSQPYRYAVWLEGQGRVPAAETAFRSLATTGPVSERGWAYNGWGNLASQYEGLSPALELFARGRASDSKFYAPDTNTAQIEAYLGRIEDSRRDFAQALSLLVAHGHDYARAENFAATGHTLRSWLFRYQGALLEAADQLRQAIAITGNGAIPLSETLTLLHEPGDARLALAQRPALLTSGNRVGAGVNALHARMMIALEAQDWPGVLATYGSLPNLVSEAPGTGNYTLNEFDPLVALALAHTGKLAAAEARLRPMPSDCIPCLIARAQVAALEQQNARADWWFGQAVTAGPSLPFADALWGQALLKRSRPDAAIVQFTLSNKKGPHFADALEGWGEALIAKNQSHLALAKFSQAEKYAPNWGRLHLKWGEALYYSGKRDEAKAQFARTSRLDLTPSEKSELARVGHV